MVDFLYPWCYIRKRASILPYPSSSSPNACASSEGGSCPRSIQDLTRRCRAQTEARHFHFSSSFTKIDHSMDWFLGKPALKSMRFLNTRRSCNMFTPANWKKLINAGWGRTVSKCRRLDNVQIATARNATQPMQKRSLWPACSQVTFLNQFVAIVFNGHAAILPLSLGRWEVCGTMQYGTNLRSISHNQTGTPICMVPYWVQGGQASLTDIHIHVSNKHPFRPAYGVSLPAGMAQKTSLCQLNISVVRSHPRCGKLCQLSNSDIYIYIWSFSISLVPILKWLLKSWFACLNPHALKTRGQWILGWSKDVFYGNHRF